MFPLSRHSFLFLFQSKNIYHSFFGPRWHYITLLYKLSCVITETVNGIESIFSSAQMRSFLMVFIYASGKKFWFISLLYINESYNMTSVAAVDLSGLKCVVF